MLLPLWIHSSIVSFISCHVSHRSSGIQEEQTILIQQSYTNT